MTGSTLFRGKLTLFVILLAFWVILTATLAAYDLVLGAICSALTAAITVALMGRALDVRFTPGVFLRLPLFILRLIWEIIKANIDVAKIIIDPKLPVDPRIVRYRTFLTGDLPRTFFADSITLTPGTVTVDIQDDTLSIHCLCPYHEEGLAGLETLVAWLFKVKQDVKQGVEREIEQGMGQDE